MYIASRKCLGKHYRLVGSCIANEKPWMIGTLCLVFLIGFAFLNACVFASEEEITQETEIEESTDALFDLSLQEFLDVEVVSVSKKKENISTAPGTVYVITEEEIRLYGFRNLQEALKYVPSVYLYDPHSWVWGGQRGFVSNFSQTLLLINGREVNNLVAGEGFISRQFSHT